MIDNKERKYKIEKIDKELNKTNKELINNINLSDEYIEISNKL